MCCYHSLHITPPTKVTPPSAPHLTPSNAYSNPFSNLRHRLHSHPDKHNSNLTCFIRPRSHQPHARHTTHDRQHTTIRCRRTASHLPSRLRQLTIDEPRRRSFKARRTWPSPLHLCRKTRRSSLNPNTKQSQLQLPLRHNPRPRYHRIG